MGLKVTNNAFGTLNAGITNSDTTVVLQSGQGSRFPSLSSGDYFYATLIDTSNNLEIVKVTARSTDTMTIVRAQDNTTARAYTTNDRFELRPTAALLNEVITKADTAQATADAALPKAGGTMTGALVIQSDDNTLTLESASASSRSTLKLNTNGNDWEFGARGSSNGTHPNSLYIYDNAASAFRMVIDSGGRVTTQNQPSILCKVFRASSTIGYYSLEAKSSRNLSVGTYGGNSAIIAPVAGVYAVNFNGITSSSTGRVDLMLYKNGTTFMSSLTQEGVSGYQYRSIATTIVLAQGDALQIYHGTAVAPYYASGSGGDLEWCNFSVTLIG
jgi:hypothetical protein